MKSNSGYNTIVVLMTALVILFLIYNQRIFLSAAVSLAFLCIFFPRATAFIHQLWMKFGSITGSVTNKVLLTLIFFLILLPFSFLAKSFKKISILLQRREKTYYQERNYEFDRHDLEKMW
jgi:hypothetical protein